MKNASWASIYLSRFLALLGFFLASPAFADCPGFYTGICRENSTNIPIILGTSSGVCNGYGSSSVIVERSRSETATRCTLNYGCSLSGGGTNRNNSCSYLKADYIPTPTPSPTPTPQPCPRTSGPSGAAATGYCIWSQNSQGADYCVKFKGKSYLEWYNSLPVGTCIDGCDYNVNPDADDGYYYYKHDQPKVNGWTQVGYTYTTMGTGRTCQSPPFDPNEPPPNLSMPPQSCGEVNGQKVCFDQKPPIGTDGIDTKEETKSNSDGSKTETKTETTCVGNTCETTKTDTTKDASGNSTGTTTTTTTENKESYCSKNPQSTQCKGDDFCKTNADLSICKEGKWSETSCGSVPACSGDAVQCAQAANAFKTYCESKKTADALYGTGQGLDEAQSAVDSAMSFGAGSGSLLGDSGSVGIGSFDQSNPFGSSCLNDMQVAVFEGYNITFPFSQMCGFLEALGRIAVAATLLAAGLFVFRD